MTDTPAQKPIADDVPVETAWKVGRRIYIRCGYNSNLNAHLREIGARWDAEVRALFVGTGKLDKVLPLVRDHVKRLAQVNEVRQSFRWVTIPYDAETVRAEAKRLGGVWDGTRKQWGMPDDESLATITTQVTEWQQARDKARAAERAAYQAEVAAVAAEAAAAGVTEDAARHERVIATSGRTVTDERGTANGRLVGRMRRAEAEQRKPQPGTVRRLSNGRRALVLESHVEFWSQDAIDDGLTDGSTGDEPGWYWRYDYAVVEPTDDERAVDAAEAAERADQEAIAALIRDAKRAADTTEVTGPLDYPAGATITEYGGSWANQYGKVTVADDGTCWYYHPGFYDDYRAVAGPITDEAVIDRARAVVAGGERTRGVYKVAAAPVPRQRSAFCADGSPDPSAG